MIQSSVSSKALTAPRDFEEANTASDESELTSDNEEEDEDEVDPMEEVTRAVATKGTIEKSLNFIDVSPTSTGTTPTTPATVGAKDKTELVKGRRASRRDVAEIALKVQWDEVTPKTYATLKWRKGS
ncbi:hypothetical protein HOY82DRAFT_536709 [Tuber indicum]|nr:hypothetical protein HOY82DRAFT_536709 [Tuber indicum]